MRTLKAAGWIPFLACSNADRSRSKHNVSLLNLSMIHSNPNTCCVLIYTCSNILILRTHPDTDHMLIADACLVEDGSLDCGLSDRVGTLASSHTSMTSTVLVSKVTLH